MKSSVYLHPVLALAQAQPCPCVARSPVGVVDPATTNTVTGKRGLAYNDASMANFFYAKSPLPGWAYDWEWRDNGLSTDIEFVPMLPRGSCS